jgi:type IV secretory pathway component VirB8
MLEERLNYSSIPSIEKNITKSLSYEEAMKKYAIKKYNKREL